MRQAKATGRKGASGTRPAGVCALAGMHRCGLGRWRPSEGGAAELRREPSNPHDPNAVAVFAPRRGKVGYVPRDHAPAIAALLDAGAAVEARFRRQGPAIEIRLRRAPAGAAGRPRPAPPKTLTVEAWLRAHGGRLDSRVLRDRLKIPCEIDYVDAAGVGTRRSVVLLQITGRNDRGIAHPEYVKAFCRLRGAERSFQASRITRLVPEGAPPLSGGDVLAWLAGIAERAPKRRAGRGAGTKAGRRSA